MRRERAPKPNSLSRDAKKRPARFQPRDERPRESPPARRGTDASLTFGVLPVLEALRANARRVEKIVVAEGVREARLRDILEIARRDCVRVDRVSREALERMVGPDVDLDDILVGIGPDEGALIVLLDGVEDPRNLGAVLRSVEGAGAHGVVIPERRAVGLTDTVAKSSAGAAEYVKVAKVTNLNRAIEDLKRRNIWVVGTSGNATTSYTEWDWRQPSALVLGAEGSGLHRLVAENCDVLVKIPMYGRIESLNVSVAAGVVLFEARRQRSGA